jgi:hypothetical protein
VSLGPRFRGDERGESSPDHRPFVPAEAGTQCCTNRFSDVESYSSGDDRQCAHIVATQVFVKKTKQEALRMKLYMHPVSMTTRPVRLFAAENKIAMDEELVDLMTGAHLQPPYSKINPNCLVPMLEDGDLKLTESSAILKYLADKIGSPAYPKDLKQRDKVNEAMD